MNDAKISLLVIFGVFVLMALVGFGMWGCPTYMVWQQELAGQAELARAEHNRQIAINEAQATKDSSKFLAEAEVERARGVAEANKIIGESLKDNESYLRYLWVLGLSDGNTETIYVPTEANMPILEATRRLRVVPSDK